MVVVNELLNYKNLKIVQHTQMFKFSLDSVLLANFVSLKPSVKQILDIGCGNGPIPLILSTKTKASITGVEIQEKIYQLAKKSININNLEKQINIINANINEIYKSWESDIFDVIVCNPPYFKIAENARLNNNVYKTIARHEVYLTLTDIMLVSKKLLKNNGSLALVHRPERMIEIIDLMKTNNIIPKKLQFVYPKKGKSSNIMLIEGRKNGNEGLEILDPIFVFDENNEYTKEIQSFFE